MIKRLSLALSQDVAELLKEYITYPTVDVETADFTEVSAIVVSDAHVKDMVHHPQVQAFSIPLFVITKDGDRLIKASDDLPNMKIYTAHRLDESILAEDVETAAIRYEYAVLPPFFRTLAMYSTNGNLQFDCPGHQGGDFFKRHPAGRAFYNFYGPNVFTSDLCNADVKLGDLLIHEGPACDAQQHAADVFNADKTYFVLNGTSSANKMVLNALLAPGDVVLYDRNNHKSISHGALVQAGAIPVYLETARNPFGSIGGILDHCFEENYIRQLVAQRDPEKAKEERPIRLAVIQLGTYDGTIYNARQVVDQIGHLCDYILFDSAWVGYEQFIPMMKDCSPLLLELGPNDPGILVTQSVHKHQAGFSQASQVHKKDRHIKGQARYVNHKRMNNAFMMHASTSPFYPLFASLDVNAKMHEGLGGQYLWKECVKVAIEARKSVLTRCQYIRPLVPPMVHGQCWEAGDTERMAEDLSYFRFEPNGKWHSFQDYGENQYFIDPCKFQLITPGIDVETGDYESFGIPATILAHYLRDRHIIPEKCDLNTILFLMTPAETKEKMDQLVSHLVEFERLIDRDAPLEEVLPYVYHQHWKAYDGYTIRQLCQEMHNFYKDRNVSDLQRKLFLQECFPDYVKSPQEANFDFVRGHGELVPVSEAVGRMALEGALPYPPGVLCVQPGERWSETARDYFLALEEGINRLPGFAPEIQGVYLQEQEDGTKKAFAYVLQESYESR